MAEEFDGSGVKMKPTQEELLLQSEKWENQEYLEKEWIKFKILESMEKDFLIIIDSVGLTDNQKNKQLLDIFNSFFEEERKNEFKFLEDFIKASSVLFTNTDGTKTSWNIFKNKLIDLIASKKYKGQLIDIAKEERSRLMRGIGITDKKLVVNPFYPEIPDEIKKFLDEYNRIVRIFGDGDEYAKNIKKILYIRMLIKRYENSMEQRVIHEDEEDFSNLKKMLSVYMAKYEDYQTMEKYKK